MKFKKFFPYFVIAFVFSGVLFFVFYNNSLKMTSSSVGAAVTPIASDDTKLISAAKVMIKDKYLDTNGYIELTVRDLVNSYYLSSDDTNPLSGLPYSENVRIIANIENGKIEDIYVKNEPFRNVYSCMDVCYIDSDYIIYNNEIYKIMKVDSDGYVYITNNKKETTTKSNIDSKLMNIYNKADKTLVKSVITITNTDLENSNIIEKDTDLFVNSSVGYMKYDVLSNEVKEIDDEQSNLLVVIILNNNITYELGDGSKFYPYIVNN